MGARDAARGQQAADALGGRFVPLDVTSDAFVADAAETVAAAGGLDVLVNNAGIPGPHSPAAELTAQDALAVYDTNVVSVVRITSAFVPILRRPGHPRRRRPYRDVHRPLRRRPLLAHHADRRPSSRATATPSVAVARIPAADSVCRRRLRNWGPVGY
jgi:NAD(P)-dependent dehydrogenase (short-subunit alcohol dehydrogenase family)